MNIFPAKKVKDLTSEECEVIVVSICCITYNHVRFIKDAIDSFLEQDVTFGVEILINDDSSNDGTKEVLLEYRSMYPHLIKLNIQEQNQYSLGVRGMNIKFNIPRAKGRYLAFCEGDDFWSCNNKLIEQISLLEKENTLSACATYVDNINEFGEIIEVGCPSKETMIYDKKEALEVFFPTLSIVSRSNVFEHTEIKNLNVFNSDFLNLVLMCHYGKIAKMNFIGGCYRKHSNGVYTSRSYVKNSLTSIKTRQVILKELRFLNKDEKKLILKDIRNRKKKLSLYLIKRLNFKVFFEVILNL